MIETGKNELIVKKGFNKKIFEISYKSIKSIESDTAERVGLTRLIALGLFAFVFKKTDKFLKITYKDNSGIDVTIVFGKLKADEWKGLILKNMKKSKGEQK